MALYYVTSAQVPGVSPTFNIYIQKSTDGGANWTTVYNGPLGTTNFDVVDIGGVLHIFGDNVNDNNHLWVFRFDTSTDSMLDAGTDLGVNYVLLDGIKVGQFATGKVLLSFCKTGTQLSTYLYDPALNSISAGVDIDVSGAGRSYGLVIDPGSDSGFVFYDTTGIGRPVSCVPVSNANVQSPSVTAFSLDSANHSPRNIGKPCFSGGKICIPFIPDLNSAGTVRVARASPSATPVFADELVYTAPGPPYIWTLTNKDWFIPSALDVAGTLYVLFQTNINQNDDNTSQASLMYATSTVPGTWSVAAVAFTGPTQSDGLSVYPVALGAGGIGVIACYANPVTTFPIAGTLLVKYITLSSSSTVALGQSIAFQGSSSNNGPTNLLFEIGVVPTVTLTFNFRVSEIPTSNPGPIINPTQCIEQDGTTSGGGVGPPLPPLPPPIPPGVTLPVITTLTVPGGTVGFFYPAFAFSASGAGPITWHATGLPPSLGLSINGFLFGNVVGPAGTFSFQVTATNSSGTSAPVTFSITIGAFGVAPSITNVSPLPNANVGTPYAITFTANGTAPITWSSLIPINTFFDPVTAIFSFTPTAVGVINFQVRATNGAGDTGLLPFSITVDPPAIPIPPIIPTPPGG